MCDACSIALGTARGIVVAAAAMFIKLAVRVLAVRVPRRDTNSDFHFQVVSPGGGPDGFI